MYKLISMVVSAAFICAGCFALTCLGEGISSSPHEGLRSDVRKVVEEADSKAANYCSHVAVDYLEPWEVEQLAERIRAARVQANEDMQEHGHLIHLGYRTVALAKWVYTTHAIRGAVQRRLWKDGVPVTEEAIKAELSKDARINRLENLALEIGAIQNLSARSYGVTSPLDAELLRRELEEKESRLKDLFRSGS